MLGRLIGGNGVTDRLNSAARSRVPAAADGVSVTARDDARHNAESVRAQVVLPRDRRGTTVNIIWGDRERLPDAKPRHMSGYVAFALKAAATVVVLGAIQWGPSYYSCRQMKDRGMFYYGTTISGCMGEKIDARNAYIEELGRKLIPAL